MKKILIIEDDPGNLDIIAMVCADDGFNVLKRDSSIAIDDIVTGFSPDLIFIDIILGDTNGAQLCQELRCNPFIGGVQIVLMSACTRSLAAAKASGCADGYLSKPFDIADITNMTANLLSMG